MDLLVNENTFDRKRRSKSMEVFLRLRRNRLAMLGLVILLVLVLAALLANWIAPYPFDRQDLNCTFNPPSLAHWLGTDEFGRDILSRIIFGARVSLEVGVLVVSFAVTIGGLLGAVAGYYSGVVDNLIMRVMDVLLSIPSLLLAIAIAASLGGGLFNLMLAVGFSSIPGYARLVRASTLTTKGMEYIEAAKAAGSNDMRIIIQHILPNCAATVIIQATLGMAFAILMAAALSFIGLGIQPPNPEWGSMLAGGRSYIRDYPYLTLFPGLAIMITILALNFLGDGLRDALDPKLRNGSR